MALSKLFNITLNCTIYYGLKNTVNNLASKNSANAFFSLRRFCLKCIMKVLNVVEKPDAAKNIVGYLSRGTSKRINIYAMHSVLSVEIIESSICFSLFNVFIYESYLESCKNIFLNAFVSCRG